MLGARLQLVNISTFTKQCKFLLCRPQGPIVNVHIVSKYHGVIISVITAISVISVQGSIVNRHNAPTVGNWPEFRKQVVDKTAAISMTTLLTK